MTIIPATLSNSFHSILFYSLLFSPILDNMEASVAAHAFAPVANRVTISNMIIEKFATPLIDEDGAITTAGRSDWAIDRCEIRSNHAGGALITGGNMITNSYIHDNGNLAFSPLVVVVVA